MTTVRKDVLSRAIGTTVKAVGANPVIPLLSNILFESNNGKSRVAATNLEIGISYTFPSSGEEFRTCIPARVVSSLVDVLNAEEVDLELNAEEQSISIMTESSTNNIRCAPADEFPEIPKVTKPSFTMEVVQFKAMVSRVAFASSAGSEGPLAGVQLSIEGGKLIMFAVDGYHFSYEQSELLAVSRDENIPFIVKGTTLETISRILPEEGVLSVQAEESKAMFHCGDVDVITQLMSGEFPAHERLREAVPPKLTTLTISTLELLRAARQLRIFASDTGASMLNVTGMLARYSAVAKERGDSDITFAAIKVGKDVTIGLNVNLLYELLEVCKTEFITVELSGAHAPIVFKMQGFDDFYHVIMPIVL